MSYNLFTKYVRIFLFCIAALPLFIQSEPTRLNNADPYPLFSSSGKYDLLTTDAIRSIQESLECDNEAYGLSERFHLSISAFYQSASDGTDYRGNNTVTWIDNTNVSPQQSSALLAASAATGTPPAAQANIANTTPMPLGAIPEAFNYFALFYPYSEDTTITQNNLASKVLANYLGYPQAEHLSPVNGGEKLPATCGCTGGTGPNALKNPCYDPLQYGYENYHNNYYNVLAYPPSRDPQRLFGYGYFDMQYQKYGARAQLEFRVTPLMGMRIYGGVAQIKQDRINILDTTTNYQGPTAAHMFQRYPDVLNPAIASTDRSLPYLQPNLYQLTTYSVPEINEDVTIPDYADNGKSAAFTTKFTDFFKSLYLQNIQNNYLGLAQVLGINLSPYNYTGFEDTTVEWYWRTLKVYNAYKEDDSWEPYTIMPMISARFTIPTSPQVPASWIFAKPLSNNGHWELGGTMGCVVNFLNSVSLGCDVGVSYFTKKWYNGMPVPTNTFQEGIYTYKGNVLRDPGINFTLGIGMNADHFLDRISFFGEYRLVIHTRDCFTIGCVQNPFPVVMVENIKQNNTTQTGPEPASSTTCVSDTITNPWGTVPIPEGTGVSIVPGVIYTDPMQTSIPVPGPEDVYVQHLVDTSAWTVNMANMALKFDISEYTSLGIGLQFPFSVTNAYNSSTLNFTLEMEL